MRVKIARFTFCCAWSAPAAVSHAAHAGRAAPRTEPPSSRVDVPMIIVDVELKRRAHRRVAAAQASGRPSGWKSRPQS